MRLVFIWEWENFADHLGETLVTVELKSSGDKGTEVKVTHERFADSASWVLTTGWTELLQFLQGFVDSHTAAVSRRGETV